MAFSYQEHHPFLLDSLYLTQHVGEMAGAASSCFLYPYSPQAVAAATDAGAYDGSSCTLDTCRNVPSVDNHIVSSPPSHDVENVLKQQGCIMENKRKRGDEASLISGDSQDVKKGRSRKQKRSSGGLKGTDEKKSKTGEGKGSKACSDPSVGFVHVRARRGQATDSHSLAERVRREKISERMKMLQGLVPGCEKVTGKALMLDEIINYVQSLQNQVEFLSMKIASLSPIFYNMDFDDCINQSQFQKLMRSIPEPVPSVDQTSHLQAKVFGNGGTNYQMMDHSTPPNLLQQVQGPSTFSQGGGCVPQVGAQRQGFDDQLGFANMCSFQ